MSDYTFNNLMRYLEELRKLQDSGYNCRKEIAEVISELRDHLSLTEGGK